jgi:hypothetical protein
MNDLSMLLPRDKHDFERVNALKNLDKDELIVLIPELLTWLQDSNWPISSEVSILLLTVPAETIPYIREVLGGNDDIWKEWCLRDFVMPLPAELRQLLKEDISRIAHNPTRGETLEEVHLTARELLKEFN